MIQFKENARTDGRTERRAKGRTDRRYFIGPFRLPPGVQLKWRFYANLPSVTKLCHTIPLRLLLKPFQYSTYINTFVPNAPFLYPLKTSEMFSGGRERMDWEQMGYDIQAHSMVYNWSRTKKMVSW